MACPGGRSEDGTYRTRSSCEKGQSFTLPESIGAEAGSAAGVLLLG